MSEQIQNQIDLGDLDSSHLSVEMQTLVNKALSPLTIALLIIQVNELQKRVEILESKK